MRKKVRELPIRYQLFLSITVCIVTNMTIFLFTITGVLENYLITQLIEIEKDRAVVIERGISTIYNSTDEYIRMMASDIRLLEGMNQYKHHKEEDPVGEKNTIVTIASKSFSSTALAKQLTGAVLLDDEGNLLYVGQNLDTYDVNIIISKEQCEQTKIISKPVWEQELFTIRNDIHSKEYHVQPVYKVLRNIDSGEFLGYLVLLVNEEAFYNLYNKTSLYIDGSFYLLNEDNTLLSTSDREILGSSLPDTLLWIKEVSCELRWENVPTLYVSKKLGNLTLLCKIGMNNLVEQKQNLWSGAIRMISLLTLLLCFCAWKISSRITKPFYILSNVMHRVEKETDMSVRVEGTFYGEMAILSNGFNDLMDKLQNAMQSIYQKERERRRLELMLLQEQVNPHFLYNTLETISSLLLLHMEEKAMQVSRSLSEFYKLSLSKGKDIIALEDEFRIAEDYLEIQSIRYVEYMEYSIECEDSILDCYVPKLLIQPIIENAIYHGLKKQKEKGMLLVNGFADQEGRKVIIEVIDTGNGMEHEKLSQIEETIRSQKLSTTSFGISNVTVRLKAMFGEEGSLSITSTVDVATKVRMEFPMIRKGEKNFLTYRENNYENFTD